MWVVSTIFYAWPLGCLGLKKKNFFKGIGPWNLIKLFGGLMTFGVAWSGNVASAANNFVAAHHMWNHRYSGAPHGAIVVVSYVGEPLK
jgi:hypothetical protein